MYVQVGKADDILIGTPEQGHYLLVGVEITSVEVFHINVGINVSQNGVEQLVVTDRVRGVAKVVAKLG